MNGSRNNNLTHNQSIHMQSEAFESFAQDFSLMKKTILQLSHKINL